MKSFILKYKWWFSFVCCALLVACEPATTSDQNPISFGAGRKNSAYNPDLNDGINATLWGYRTYKTTTLQLQLQYSTELVPVYMKLMKLKVAMT